MLHENASVCSISIPIQAKWNQAGERAFLASKGTIALRTIAFTRDSETLSSYQWLSFQYSFNHALPSSADWKIKI